MLRTARFPLEATVDAFLKKMFGWNQQLTWKVADIKPSEAPGISEATVVFSTPQGQQVTRIYVTPDQKYAFTGDLVPFGADPFAACAQGFEGLPTVQRKARRTRPLPSSSSAIWSVPPARRRSRTSRS